MKPSEKVTVQEYRSDVEAEVNDDSEDSECRVQVEHRGQRLVGQVFWDINKDGSAIYLAL